MNKKQEIKNRIDLINKGEVPTGYKNSWGYVYPEEWDLSTLNSLCSKVQKKNKENAQLQVLTNSATKGVILQEEYFDREIVNNENTDGYYIVEAGDFMYNPRISAAAPAGPINRNNLGISGIASPLYSIFRAKQTTNTNFIERYFESSFWHGYMKRVSNQGARHDRLNLLDEDFYKMPIPQPKVEEQEKIAEILSCCDKVIELKENLLIEKKQEKKYLMQKLYTPKIDWIKCSVSKFGNVVTGNTPSTDIKEYYGTEYPWITPSDINSNKYIYKGDRNLSNIGITKARLLPKDSVLVTCIASIGKNAILKVKGSCNQQINAIIPNDSMSADFIYYLIENNTLLLKKYAGTSATSIINKDTFENLVFKIPNNKQEQIKIAEILSQFDKEIELLEQELEQYKQLKKSLSQLLLTGIVRVNEV